jgi:hypothetical protein
VLPGPLAWPAELAPLLVALCWRADQAWAVPVVDAWGPRADKKLQAHSIGSAITIAGDTFAVVAAADGRLATLRSPDGSDVLSVTGWP